MKKIMDLEKEAIHIANMIGEIPLTKHQVIAVITNSLQAAYEAGVKKGEER